MKMKSPQKRRYDQNNKTPPTPALLFFLLFCCAQTTICSHKEKRKEVALSPNNLPHVGSRDRRVLIFSKKYVQVSRNSWGGHTLSHAAWTFLAQSPHCNQPQPSLAYLLRLYTKCQTCGWSANLENGSKSARRGHNRLGARGALH